ISIETEKIEKENKLLELKIKQAEIQFFVDLTLMVNKAHRIFNQKKIDYALNSNENSIRKYLADDEVCNKSSLSLLACTQITFEEEESFTSAISYIPANPVEFFTSKDLKDIANIDKLENDAIFCFLSDIEEI
ncbi:5835_t:CDS:2, partial [Funneliformis mosseae]